VKKERKDVSASAPTVGKVAIALQEKAGNATSTHSVVDQTQSQTSEYLDNLIQCVNENKPKIVGNFYVVVITKKEKLLENVLRNYFFSRMTCPTPDYDQALFYYDAKADQISFIWVIPDKETCVMMIKNMGQIAPEEHELLQFVIDFSSGKLFQLAKKLNGESKDSVILEN